jgi:hypothetical protein
LPLLSQHHSTTLPSPNRYDKRYEEKVSIIFTCTSDPRGHGGPGDVEVRETGLSPASVLMVSTALIPSESHENGF